MCERVIQNENQALTIREVHNKWVKAMDLRLEIDCQMTNPRFEKKALRKSLVRETWKGTLFSEADLLEDWTQETGVLVGIRPRERDGRGRER